MEQCISLSRGNWVFWQPVLVVITTDQTEVPQCNYKVICFRPYSLLSFSNVKEKWEKKWCVSPKSIKLLGLLVLLLLCAVTYVDEGAHLWLTPCGLTTINLHLLQHSLRNFCVTVENEVTSFLINVLWRHTRGYCWCNAKSQCFSM